MQVLPLATIEGAEEEEKEEEEEDEPEPLAAVSSAADKAAGSVCKLTLYLQTRLS